MLKSPGSFLDRALVTFLACARLQESHGRFYLAVRRLIDGAHASSILVSNPSTEHLTGALGDFRIYPDYGRNLPFKISADEMYDIFGKYGAIRQVNVPALIADPRRWQDPKSLGRIDCRSSAGERFASCNSLG